MQNDQKTRTLQEWRAICELSKSDVARHLKIHPSTYARLECNPEMMSVETAFKLTELFQCEMKQIIFFRKKPNLNLDIKLTS